MRRRSRQVLIGILVVTLSLGHSLGSGPTSYSPPPRKLAGWLSLFRKPDSSESVTHELHKRHPGDVPSVVKQQAGKASISRIIHQSWKTDKVDPSLKDWRDSWRLQNPEWTYILWTDDMNRKLVERHYPWFLDTYDNFPQSAAGILRADSVRYMYLHHFGGVYADLDFRALKPMDDLFINGTHIALAGKISDAKGDDTWENNVPNAWMASALPGHPLWLMCLAQVIKQASLLDCEGASCLGDYRIEKTTGPMLFRNVVKDWLAAGNHPKFPVHLLREGLIYPIDWRTMYDNDHVCHGWQKRSEKSCYEHFPNAYAITYWSHVWDIHHRDDEIEDSR